MKTCKRCGVTKERVFFANVTTSMDGKRGNCRVCETATQAVLDRVYRTGRLSLLPTQPSAEAHRLWMRVSADWARAVAA